MSCCSLAELDKCDLQVANFEVPGPSKGSLTTKSSDIKVQRTNDEIQYESTRVRDTVEDALILGCRGAKPLDETCAKILDSSPRVVGKDLSFHLLASGPLVYVCHGQIT